MPSLVEIGPPVPKEEIFEGFLPFLDMARGHGGHLDHATCSELFYVYTGSPFLKMFHIKIAFDWPRDLREDL